jgi:tRNA(adenine34) deaminase
MLKYNWFHIKVMNNNDFFFFFYMQQALIEAQTALKRNEVPVGVVIVCNNKIIAKAHNMTEKLNDVTAHAEILAITSATATLGGKYLNNCTIYVTLEPCIMCAGALGLAQVERLVYGAKDVKRGYSKYKPSSLHPKTKVVSGILSEKCSELIKKFFIKKRV